VAHELSKHPPPSGWWLRYDNVTCGELLVLFLTPDHRDKQKCGSRLQSSCTIHSSAWTHPPAGPRDVDVPVEKGDRPATAKAPRSCSPPASCRSLVRCPVGLAGTFRKSSNPPPNCQRGRYALALLILPFLSPSYSPPPSRCGSVTPLKARAPPKPYLGYPPASYRASTPPLSTMSLEVHEGEQALATRAGCCASRRFVVLIHFTFLVLLQRAVKPPHPSPALAR
jgi:hypothetical protein